MAPLPIKYLTYQSIVIWSLFSTMAFVLSQQVYVCAIIPAIVLHDVVARLDREVREDTASFERRSARGWPFRLNEREMAVAEEKVIQWETRRMQMLLFCGEITDFFGVILMVIYGLDFLTLLGFSSNIVNSTRTDLPSYLYLALSCAISLAYLTVFLFPLVAVYEKVSVLYRSAVFGYFLDPPGNHPRGAIFPTVD